MRDKEAPTLSTETQPLEIKMVVYPTGDLEAWEKVRESILRLQMEADFKDHTWSEKALKKCLNQPGFQTILLYDTSKKSQNNLIGYTWAAPIGYWKGEEKARETATVGQTVIDKDYRGKGLVAPLMNSLEEELKQNGYSYIDRDALVNNGYADSIRRHYGERIVFERDSTDNLPDTPRKFFRIKL